MMPDSAFGRSEECPFCSQRFMITNPPPEDTASPWVVQWMGHVTPAKEEKLARDNSGGGAMERFARWMTVGLLLVLSIAGGAWYVLSRERADDIPEGFYANALDVAKNTESKPEREEAYSLIVRSLAKSGKISDAERLLRRVTDAEQRLYASIAIAEAKHNAGDTRTAERELEKLSTNLFSLVYRRSSGKNLSPQFFRTAASELQAAQIRCGMVATSYLTSYLYVDSMISPLSCDLADYYIDRKDSANAKHALDLADQNRTNMGMYSPSVTIDEEIAMLLRLAKGYRILGNHPDKVKELLDAAFTQLNGRVSDKKPLYFMQLAEEQYNAGLHEAADESLQAAEKAAFGLPPNGMEFAKIKYFANTDRTDEALELGKKFMEKTEFDAFKFIVADYLAKLMQKSGKHDEAVEFLDDLLAAVDHGHPNVSHFYFMLIDTYFSIDESAKAVEIYNRKNDLFNYDETFVLLLLIGQYHRQGLQDDEAEKSFTEAVRRIPLLSQPLYLPPSIDKGDDIHSPFKVLFEAYDAPVKPLPATTTGGVTTTSGNTEDDPAGNEKPPAPVIIQPEPENATIEDDGPIEFDGTGEPKADEPKPDEPKTDVPQPIVLPVQPVPVRPVPVAPPRVRPGTTEDNAARPVPVRPVPVRPVPVPPRVRPVAPAGVTDNAAPAARPIVRPPARAVNPNISGPDENVPGRLPVPAVPQKIQRDPFGNPIKVVNFVDAVEVESQPWTQPARYER